METGFVVMHHLTCLFFSFFQHFLVARGDSIRGLETVMLFSVTAAGVDLVSYYSDVLFLYCFGVVWRWLFRDGCLLSPC